MSLFSDVLFIHFLDLSYQEFSEMIFNIIKNLHILSEIIFNQVYLHLINHYLST